MQIKLLLLVVVVVAIVMCVHFDQLIVIFALLCFGFFITRFNLLGVFGLLYSYKILKYFVTYLPFNSYRVCSNVVSYDVSIHISGGIMLNCFI